MTRSRGFALIELMISISVVTVVFAAAGSVLWQSARSEKQFAAYARDIGDCRRVLRVLERDLRRATQFETTAERHMLTVDGSPVSYRLEDGVLTRKKSGHAVVLARSLAAFELRRVDDLVHVILQLRPRSKAVMHRKARVTTQVALRREAR